MNKNLLMVIFLTIGTSCFSVPKNSAPKNHKQKTIFATIFSFTGIPLIYNFFTKKKSSTKDSKNKSLTQENITKQDHLSNGAINISSKENLIQWQNSKDTTDNTLLHSKHSQEFPLNIGIASSTEYSDNSSLYRSQSLDLGSNSSIASKSTEYVDNSSFHRSQPSHLKDWKDLDDNIILDIADQNTIINDYNRRENNLIDEITTEINDKKKHKVNGAPTPLDRKTLSESSDFKCSTEMKTSSELEQFNDGIVIKNQDENTNEVFAMDHKKFQEENEKLLMNLEIQKTFIDLNNTPMMPELVDALNENKQDLLAILNFSQFFYRHDTIKKINKQLIKNISLDDCDVDSWCYNFIGDTSQPDCDMTFSIRFKGERYWRSITFTLDRTGDHPILKLSSSSTRESVNHDNQRALIKFIEHSKKIHQQLTTMDKKDSGVYLSKFNNKIREFFSDENLIRKLASENKSLTTMINIDGVDQEVIIKVIKNSGEYSSTHRIQVEYTDEKNHRTQYRPSYLERTMVYTFQSHFDRQYEKMDPFVVNYLNFTTCEVMSMIDRQFNNLSSQSLINLSNVINAVDKFFIHNK
jgi:hypothetical protein